MCTTLYMSYQFFFPEGSNYGSSSGVAEGTKLPPKQHVCSGTHKLMENCFMSAFVHLNIGWAK